MSDEFHKRCKILWIPAKKVHAIICLDCGVTLCADVETLGEFRFPGKCEIPENTLGIHVKDGLLVEDFFGGKPVKVTGDDDEDSEMVT